MATTSVTRTLVHRRFSLRERIEHYSAPNPDTGCRLWTGGLFRATGYGRLTWERRSQLAHRLAWEVANGPIPEGLLVCHKCDVPACVNPDHLFLGTNADNMADRDAKGRHTPLVGIRHNLAKLDEAAVLAIRADTRSHAVVARQYGVTLFTISKIRLRKIWKHI